MRFALLPQYLISKIWNYFRTFFIVGFVLTGLPQTVLGALHSIAYVGQPFGVGRVTIDVLRGEPLLPLSDERFTLLEANGRAIYPVLKQEPVRKIIRGLLDGLLELEAPRKVTIYYLFQGDEPFELSVFTPNEQGVRVSPLRNSSRHRQMLNKWWEQSTQYYEKLLKDRAYPPVAENFLIATLSRRLDLPIPKPRQGLFRGNNKQDSAWNDLFVNEAHRLRIDRAMLQEVPTGQLDMTALPEPIEWGKRDPNAKELEEVAVELLATHVPAECFYLRFGNFTNYLWFRDLNKKWQGDLGNMILRRGIKRGAGERIQQQLSLRENALAKIFGPQVIADAAIIGLDPYIEQGAAIGILFQAKNDVLLSTDLIRQRREALTKFDDAEEQTVEIEGQAVSLISTPQGQVRSYYVQHEGFHLVTTSRTLVKRFLQAGQRDRSLADLASFRHFRQQFPLDREDAMVAFVSEQFWRNLCSPHYLVENLRRLRSSRESLLLELARYAAAGEGKVGQTAEELIAAEILPTRFAARVDGTLLQAVEEGSVDSQRGARGYYVPIADMPVEQVSLKEATTFQYFKEKLRKSIRDFPPIGVAVHRTPGRQGAPETISVDIQAQGALRKMLGSVGSWLGQPSDKKLQPVVGDLFSVEVVIDTPIPVADNVAQGESFEHHLFGALRDFRSPLVVKRGEIQPDAAYPELVRGYLGAWPRPGWLTWLTSLSGVEQAKGPEPEPVGDQIWQAKQENFLLLSFKPEVIRQVLPQLNLLPADRPGQLWVQLEDLTGTQMAENVNALGYMRTRETSAAGSRMMNSLANQLRVPRNECRAVAERLVDGTFVCPLGGEYRLFAPKRGLEVWISAALPEQNRFLLTEVPEDFSLPMLDWFRGLTGDLRLDEQALSVHLEVKMTKAALP